MNSILAQLNKLRYPVLDENLESGLEHKFTVPTKGDWEGLEWASDRYLDAKIFMANISSDNDYEDDEFPREYTIDASALTLAYIAQEDEEERGLTMLSSREFCNEISDLLMLAFDTEDPILDMIKHVDPLEEQEDEEEYTYDQEEDIEIEEDEDLDFDEDFEEEEDDEEDEKTE